MLKWLRGDALTSEYWLELFRICEMKKGIQFETCLFGDFLNVSKVVILQADKIKQLNQRAQGEISIREVLKEIELWAVNAYFQLNYQQDSNNHKISIIKEWRELHNQIGENQNLLQSLQDSSFFGGFKDKVDIWKKKFDDLEYCLTRLNKFQRKWLYLEPIFFRGALPEEKHRFDKITKDYRSIMLCIERDMRLVSFVSRVNLKSTLDNCITQLKVCQKSLYEYLEKKRMNFPRFYFIGDDDLLEILGQSTNPVIIQQHLKKLYAGVYSVEFDKESKVITSIKSVKSENFKLDSVVRIDNNVE
ncbi:hypothetical protein A3Q56_08273, partial [Intoshia linei]